MKTLTLTKQQARLLRLQLERKTEGYSIGDLRKIDRVLSAIENATAEYEKSLEAVIKQYATDAEGLNAAVAQIDSEIGTKSITLDLEDAHFECAKGVWSEIKAWTGTREVRRLVLAIDDAFNKPTNGE